MGDIVLVRRNLFDSQYKIADKWEEDPYEVISQMEDSPVFRIRAANRAAAPIRVLHRNMLHPARSVHEDEEHNIEEIVPMALSKANALMEAYFDV